MTPDDDTPRDVASICERLRFGDSDGTDHDLAADEIERLQRVVAGLHAAIDVLGLRLKGAADHSCPVTDEVPK